MPSNAYYKLLTTLKPVGIGVTGTLHVAMSAFAKPNGPAAPYCVANEIICSTLGRLLFLPVPPSGIALHPSTKAPLFVSLDFNLTGSALPPIDPVPVAKALPRAVTGLVLFDCLIANCDRHRGNVSVDMLATPPQMSVFDHSHALFGYEAGKGVERLEALRDRLAMTGGPYTRGNRHCLLDAIATDGYFAEWVNRIRAVPDYQIDEVCDLANGAGVTGEEVAAAKSFLKHRRDKLAEVVASHRAEFKAITTWSLVS